MNYRLLTTTAALAAALALAACGDKNTADEATSTAPGAELTEQGQLPEATDNNTAADQASIDFIQKLALSDMYEIEASKIALTKSTSPSVKSYAQNMINAHTATSAALKPIAESLKVMPPVTLDNDHAEKIADLNKASAKDFDAKYLDQQEEAHENALNALNDQAKNGSNAALVSFAAATAPKVADHLAMVKKLDESGVDEAKN
jgi:putative membrane protein